MFAKMRYLHETFLIKTGHHRCKWEKCDPKHMEDQEKIVKQKVIAELKVD